MATCNLCPADRRDIPDDEMSDHLRNNHPEVAPDGTLHVDGSIIIRDASRDAGADHDPGEDWRT